MKLTSKTDDQLAVMAHKGNKIALSLLWERSVPQATKITRKFANKYTWIDHEDLIQGVLVKFPQFIENFDPSAGTPVNKYLYFKFYFATLDLLRAEDPLGIKLPQKQHYPEWRRLGDISEDADLMETVIQQSMENLDRGYAATDI